MGVNDKAIHFWTGDNENVKVVPRAAITLLELVATDVVEWEGSWLRKCFALCCGKKCCLKKRIGKGSDLLIYTASSDKPFKTISMADEDAVKLQALFDSP